MTSHKKLNTVYEYDLSGMYQQDQRPSTPNIMLASFGPYEGGGQI